MMSVSGEEGANKGVSLTVTKAGSHYQQQGLVQTASQNSVLNPSRLKPEGCFGLQGVYCCVLQSCKVTHYTTTLYEDSAPMMLLQQPVINVAQSEQTHLPFGY